MTDPDSDENSTAWGVRQPPVATEDSEHEMVSLHETEDNDKESHTTDMEALIPISESTVTRKLEPLSSPATLPRRVIWEMFAVVLFDSSLVLFSAVFLSLAFIARNLDGKNVKDYSNGQTVIAFTRYGVTIYPILFAAVVGRTLQLLAIWLAERGEKLGLLEQLLGSVTLFGTIKTQYLLRAFNVCALSLVLLWALSPLGGQATLRVLSTTSPINNSTVPIVLFNTSAVGFMSLMAQAVPGLYTTRVDSIYNSALIAPEQIQASPRDSWGNVKVPMLDKLNSTNADKEGWISVPLDQTVAYTSLIGIPLVGTPLSGNATFQAISSYFHLDCNEAMEQAYNQTFTWPEIVDKELDDPCGTNGSWKYGSVTGSSSFGIGSLTNNSGLNYAINYTIWPPSRPLITTPRTILVQSNLRSFGRPIFVTNCTMTYQTVESRILCVSGNCSATHIRPSPNLYPEAQTPLEDCNNAKYFYDEFAFSEGVQRPYHYPPSISPNELYLFYGSEVIPANYSPVANLTMLDASIMSERLTRLVNSYWLASAFPDYVAAGGSIPQGINSSTLGEEYRIYQTEANIVTALEDVYVCDDVWLGFLVVSSVALCVCGIVSTIVGVFKISPDVFGFVSTLTRDNPLVPQAYAGSSLDGDARARLMKEVKVRLGDVEPDREVGHIALADVGSVQVERLRKGRLYD